MKQLVSMKGATQGIDLAPPSERLSLVEERHRELDARLRELGRRPYLTPKEQLEAVEIKKRKLQAKDEMVSLKRAL